MKRVVTIHVDYACYVISRNDVLMAIKKLKVLGSGFTLIAVGNSYLIQSVPGELTMDHTTLLQHAEVRILHA